MPPIFTPVRRSTPWARCRSANSAATSSPSTRVQGLGRHLEDDDLDAVLAGGAGDLEADPAAADDAQPGAFGEGRAQPLGVVPLPQVVHLGAAVVGEREVAGA